MAFHPTPSDSTADFSPWKDNQGSLPPEIDVEGNVEYKLKLVATMPDRFDHLVTQLKWRLSEGHGSAIYEIGVADDGSFVGLSPEDMEVSLQTLYRMADALSADVTILRRVSVEAAQSQYLDPANQDQEETDSPNASSSTTANTPGTTAVTTTTATATTTSTPTTTSLVQRQKSASSPRTDPEFIVVEARVTSRLSREHHFVEIRVALVGGPDAGKSTLLGRLAHGIADNGRGKARLNMLRHRHEISTGRTSSISHEIIGFDDEGTLINYNTTHISTWQEVCASSKKVVTLLDTCGHPRFLKTTIAGLTGHAPDYACLVVDSRVGGVNEMTKEHLALATLLGLPTFVVVTKMDVATHEQLRATVTALMLLIKRIGASCVDLASLETMLPKKRTTNSHATGATSGSHESNSNNKGNGGPSMASAAGATGQQQGSRRFVPVIVQQSKDLEAVVDKFTNPDRIEATKVVAIPILLISSVTGENLHLLERLLYLLPKPSSGDDSQGAQLQEDPACFQIEEIYNIPDIGTVVGGFLHSGHIEVQDTVADMGIGPASSSSSSSSSSLPSPISSSSFPSEDTHRNQRRRGRRLYLGPVDSDGSFIPIIVKSIHRQRMSMRSIDPGQMATIALDSPMTVPSTSFHNIGSGSSNKLHSKSSSSTVGSQDGDATTAAVSTSNTSAPTTTTILDTIKVRRGMVILESDTDPRGTCCQQFEAVMQVLAHEGTFGLGFQGMIHCGSVHQNARIVKIRLLSDDDKDENDEQDENKETNGEDAAGTQKSAIDMHRSPSASSTTARSTTGSETAKRTVVENAQGMMGERDDDEKEEPQSDGSITPCSEYGSGSTSSSVPGSRSGSIYRGKDYHHNRLNLLQSSDGGGGGGGSSGPKSGQSAGRIPISTMRQLHRLSLQSRQQGVPPSQSQQQQQSQQHRNLLQDGGGQEPGQQEGEQAQYVSREEEEGDDDQTVQLSVGSRARVVFEFCHDVVFMREGTTVLFRQGRTKCVGKVVRML
ncbi:GTP binding protein [Actinomortierella wolfii]|nr:GTP binding protein [Actinomortierella wolfii]